MLLVPCHSKMSHFIPLIIYNLFKELRDWMINWTFYFSQKQDPWEPPKRGKVAPLEPVIFPCIPF